MTPHRIDEGEAREAIERALCGEPNWLGFGTVDRRPGWLRTTSPESPREEDSCVLRCSLGAEEAEARIVETLRDHERLRLPLHWTVGPWSRPIDLEERLVRHGFLPLHEHLGMAADPRDFPPPDEGGVRVEECDARGIGAWHDCQMRAWGMPAAVRAPVERRVAHDLAERPQRARYVLARIDGEPVGAGSVTRYGDAAQLNGAAVVPAFRGRGAYKGLVLERMRLAREEGLSLVVVRCNPATSAPICDRMGFRTYCTIRTYRHGAGSR
jgi:hypothetical protein